METGWQEWQGDHNPAISTGETASEPIQPPRNQRETRDPVALPGNPSILAKLAEAVKRRPYNPLFRRGQIYFDFRLNKVAIRPVQGGAA